MCFTLCLLSHVYKIGHLDGSFSTCMHLVSVGTDLDGWLVSVAGAPAHAALRSFHVAILVLVNALFLLGARRQNLTVLQIQTSLLDVTDARALRLPIHALRREHQTGLRVN